ncbi:hypothetical protein LINPERPRIM_LOCUS6115, partial [Linum perenne]
YFVVSKSPPSAANVLRTRAIFAVRNVWSWLQRRLAAAMP